MILISKLEYKKIHGKLQIAVFKPTHIFQTLFVYAYKLSSHPAQGYLIKTRSNNFFEKV